MQKENPRPDVPPPINRDSCPASTLPFEIISEIFSDCLQDVHTVPDKSEVSLLLGRICKDWREVALTTPKLWSALSVHRTDRVGIVHPANLWLSRARGYPLIIQAYEPRATIRRTGSCCFKPSVVIHHNGATRNFLCRWTRCRDFILKFLFSN